MKKVLLFLILTATMAITSVSAYNVPEGDPTGLPGDNFSLTGALELFKLAESPEAFEKALNSEANNVNNLDLNGDGQIDYIRVIDKGDGNIHSIILQALITKNEVQDIAIIGIEKKGSEEAVLQIIGDEDIFGDNVIVEPKDETTITPAIENPGYDNVHGPAVTSAPVRVYVNVWHWPSVRWIYRPHYTYWVSPWGWDYYPIWWRPWRPYGWNHFYNSCYHYHTHYVVVTHYRVPNACHYYRDYRSYSPVVHKRYEKPVSDYRKTVNTARRHNANVPNRTPEVSIRSSKPTDRTRTDEAQVPSRTTRSQEPVDRNSNPLDGKTTRTTDRKSEAPTATDRNSSSQPARDNGSLGNTRRQQSDTQSPSRVNESPSRSSEPGKNSDRNSAPSQPTNVPDRSTPDRSSRSSSSPAQTTPASKPSSDSRQSRSSAPVYQPSNSQPSRSSSRSESTVGSSRSSGGSERSAPSQSSSSPSRQNSRSGGR